MCYLLTIFRLFAWSSDTSKYEFSVNSNSKVLMCDLQYALIAKIVLYHLLPRCKQFLKNNTNWATLPSLPPVNDMSEEYGLIYKILLGLASIIITVGLKLRHCKWNRKKKRYVREHASGNYDENVLNVNQSVSFPR